jgi:hypothetical protein
MKMKPLRLVILIAAALALTAVTARAEGAAADGQAQKLESSVARIKGALKQDGAEGQGGLKNLAQWGVRPDESVSDSGLKMLKALGLCAGVFLIGIALVKRVRGGAPARSGQRIKVLERALLAPKTWLVLSEVDGRRVLLAVGADRVSFHPGSGAEMLPEDLQEPLGLVCGEDIKLSA